MQLSKCQPGEGGRITSVKGSGPIVQRLMELGLYKGVEVKVIRTAPFGDPFEIKVNNTLLSLRRSEAEHVEIEE